MAKTLPPVRHTFLVTVECGTQEQADQVMAERLGYDEDYGYAYRVDHEQVWAGVLPGPVNDIGPMLTHSTGVDPEARRLARATFDLLETPDAAAPARVIVTDMPWCVHDGPLTAGGVCECGKQVPVRR